MTKEYFKLKIGDNKFDIMSNETILECAYRNGIEIKYHCASGHCGKCKVKLISGEVTLDHSGGISRDNIEKGFILACCSIPKGDIEI
ncbi:2Fe-2S iron-sulfur cluster-binding protein [Serratia plymuthica]|uniref:2Fe-2S iron-sulfur cluster-binding protein n=1 Tax=Serratia plymuthica TaxID=82996 RepID=UPI0018D7E6BA|nr:2Fe-2S iron-sulfur cluster binding domain-containing protein [Serratia plymuthica]QPS57337.1 2Fe-2S iron-sulfur cluster binding domain-containing protein [Serratia plymuthica]CAI1791936.1 Ferredoxin [Serratia plymuthica]